VRSQRLFIAAYPPPEVIEPVLAAASAILPANANAVQPDRMHLTLLFIGSVRRTEMDSLVESIDRAVSGRGPCSLTLTRLACLPESGEPRLMAAVGEGDGYLIEVQKRLAARLTRLRPKAERERFLPHVTVARLTPGSPRPVELKIDPISWNIQEVRLMESHLHPSGAVHTLVHASTLIS
jgi:2'-5' RNA ligase